MDPFNGFGHAGLALGLGPLTREGPTFGGNFFLIYIYIYIYFWEILNIFVYIFFSLLRRLKELSNIRDKDKRNLNK